MLGCDTAPATRHGDIEHQYWKEKIADKLRERGYTVQDEHPLGNGKTVDLVARRNGRKIAIEIETGKSDAAANVQKCLDASFDLVLSVATSGHVKRMTEGQVLRLGRHDQHVRVLTVHELADDDACIGVA